MGHSLTKYAPANNTSFQNTALGKATNSAVSSVTSVGSNVAAGIHEINSAINSTISSTITDLNNTFAPYAPANNVDAINTALPGLGSAMDSAASTVSDIVTAVTEPIATALNTNIYNGFTVGDALFAVSLAVPVVEEVGVLSEVGDVLDAFGSTVTRDSAYAAMSSSDLDAVISTVGDGSHVEPEYYSIHDPESVHTEYGSVGEYEPENEIKTDSVSDNSENEPKYESKTDSHQTSALSNFWNDRQQSHLKGYDGYESIQHEMDNHDLEDYGLSEPKRPSPYSEYKENSGLNAFNSARDRRINQNFGDVQEMAKRNLRDATNANNPHYWDNVGWLAKNEIRSAGSSVMNAVNKFGGRIGEELGDIRFNPTNTLLTGISGSSNAKEHQVQQHTDGQASADLLTRNINSVVTKASVKSTVPNRRKRYSTYDINSQYDEEYRRKHVKLNDK